MNRLLIYIACSLGLLIPTSLFAWMNVATIGGGTPASGGASCTGTIGSETTTVDNQGGGGEGMTFVMQVTTGACTATTATICTYTDNFYGGNINFVLYSSSGNEPADLLWDSATDGDGVVGMSGDQSANPQWVCDIITYNFEATTPYFIGESQNAETSIQHNMHASTGGLTFMDIFSTYTTPFDPWVTAGDTAETYIMDFYLDFD